MFLIFIKACKKYKFTFVLSTYSSLTMILRPNNTFENIDIDFSCHNYNKLFLKAIKTLKEYRKERGYQ